MLRIGGAAMLVIALGSFGMADAALANAPLSLDANGERLEAGAPLAATSTQFVLSAGAGKVTCTGVTLTGVVVKNGQTSTDIAELTAGGGGSCTSTMAPPLNEAVLKISVFPWNETFSQKGVTTLRSVAGEKEPVLFEIVPMEIPHGPHPALACKLSTTKLTGTTSPPNGEQLTASFSQKLRVYANSSRECGRHGAISATFTFSSGEFPLDPVLG